MDSCEDGSVHVPLQKNTPRKGTLPSDCLHGELNAGLNFVQVVKEFLQPVGRESRGKL